MSAGSTRPRAGQWGMGLVEIMIAMTIGLLVLSGLYNIYLTNKATYRVQQGLTRLQENGRYAVHMLARNARMAAYTGCGKLAQFPPNVYADNLPNAAELTADKAVGGNNNVTAGNSYGAAANTDTLNLRYVSPRMASLAAPMTSPADTFSVFPSEVSFKAGTLLAVSDCSGADIFAATNVTTQATGGSKRVVIAHAKYGSGGAPGNVSGSVSKAYTAGARLGELVSDTYFIAATGRNNDQGDPILALYRQTIDGTRQELVDNVTNMQVLFGQNNDSDGVADTYVSADAVANWSDVVSLRIGLLLRSPDPAASEVDTRTFDLLDKNTGPFNDHFLRRVFTTTVALRNRLP